MKNNYKDLNDFMRQNAGVYDNTFKGNKFKEEAKKRKFKKKAIGYFNKASFCLDGLIILVNLLTFFKPRGILAKVLYGFLTPLRRMGYTVIRMNKYRNR